MSIAGAATLSRRFAVHGAGEPPACGRIVEGFSFEDAALSFVEHEHPAADADDEVSLFVEDCETGERQCFRVDLATGEAGPCD
jgi:hypothetical protein